MSAGWFRPAFAATVAAFGIVVAAAGGAERPAAEERSPSVAGLPYLLYISDRDGDDEVYGVRADGRRTVQITRDGSDLFRDETLISPDGRWIYVARKYAVDRLVSTDGRQTRPLPAFPCFDVNGLVSDPAFSPDSRLLAYGEESDCMQGWGRIRIVPVDGAKTRVLEGGSPWSFSLDGRQLVVLATRVRGVEVDMTGVEFLDLATGGSRGHVRVAVPTWDDVPSEVGWSRDGRWYAFLHNRTVRVVDMRQPKLRSRVVLRDARLDGYGSGVRWLDAKRLGYVLRSEKSKSVEVGALPVERPARTIVLVTGAQDFPAPAWSVDGRRVAYAEENGAGGVALVTMTTGGTGQRVVFEARSVVGVEWTRDGRLVVQYRDRSGNFVALVDARGRADAVLRGYATFGAASPDGKFLDLGSGDERLRILSLPRRRVLRVPVAGNVSTLGWVAAEAGPAKAGASPPARVVERASGTLLRSSGEIDEISASGRRVAALVDESGLDCHHVVGWTAGSSGVTRFEQPKRCSYGDDRRGDQQLVAIRLEGTTVTWIGEAYGNSSYWTYYEADLARPQAGIRRTGDDMGEHGDEPGRLPPERSTRHNVSVQVSRGAIVLVRVSDGRRKTIRPPGGAVDAELEDAGLFYAFNTKGAMAGNVVFVPFDALFAPR